MEFSSNSVITRIEMIDDMRKISRDNCGLTIIDITDKSFIGKDHSFHQVAIEFFPDDYY